MKTTLLTPETDENAVKTAAELIRAGEVVGMPTETVYGLAANALNGEAVKKIFLAKGRPQDNPLIVHIADFEQIYDLCPAVPPQAKLLADAFWPGPLTMIFPKKDIVPYGTTGGLDTVAVRMPVDPVANCLIHLAGVPIAAPSANSSGRPSPTKAEHVIEDMDGKIEMIIDGGAVGIGVESTIVDVSGEIPTLLRPGAITIEMLRETVGQVEIDPAIQGPMAANVKPKAPGMKYRHYAPKAELVLVEEKNPETKEVISDRVIEEINLLAKSRLDQGQKVGIICTEETRDCYPQGMVRSLGFRSRPETIAHNLFAVLREFDDLDVDCIYSESFSKDHLGQAIMNRLTKAAGYHILDVKEEV